jgi:hypothetical protein
MEALRLPSCAEEPMFLMLGDEADAEQGKGQRFFIYGAVFIQVHNVKALSDAVEAIRKEAGLNPTDSFKFADKTRPEGVTKEAFREAKSKVLDLAAKYGIVFCSYAILHELAGNQTHEDLVLFGANTLLGKFNEYLGTYKDTYGVVLFDRIPVAHPYRYLKEKFQIGLTFLNGQTRRLERIMGLASTCDGASHLASIADILVGSFRYCVNEPDKDVAAKAMFPKLVKVMWKKYEKHVPYVTDLGFILRPQTVNEQHLRKEYDALVVRLRGYLNAGSIPAA